MFDKDIYDSQEESDRCKLIFEKVMGPEFGEKVSRKMAEIAVVTGNRMNEQVKEHWRTHHVGQNLSETKEEVDEGEEPEFVVMAGSLEELQVCLEGKLSQKFTNPVLLKTYPHNLTFESEEGVYSATYGPDEAGNLQIEIGEELEVETRFFKKGSRAALSEQKRDELAKTRRMAGLPPRPEKPQPLNETELGPDERRQRELAGLARYNTDGSNMLLNE